MALVPILGVLAGATWLWSEQGNDIENFEAAGVPAETTYQLFITTASLRRAATSLHVASLPDALPGDLERAAVDVDTAIAILEEAPERLDSLVLERNVDSELLGNIELAGQEDLEGRLASVSMMSSSIELGIELLRQQPIGEPVSPQVTALAAFGTDTVGGLVLPFSDADNQNATFLYQAVSTTVQYHDQFDRDHARLVDTLVSTSAIDGTALRSTAGLRQSLWKDALDSRNFLGDVAMIDWASTSRGSAFTTADPLETALASNSGESIQSRHLLLSELNDISRALEDDVVAAFAGFQTQRNTQLGEIVQNRRLTALVSALMAVFSVALAALTIAEVRRRRKVETAHGEAMDLLGEKAFQDPSTGVWNRRRLEAVLPPMIDQAIDRDECVVLAYLDLDHFKAINDVWGHRAGDQILQTVAERLTGFTYSEIEFELSRIGGDEFVLFASASTPKLDWLEGLGSALLDAVDDEMEVSGRRHEVNASIGIATSTADSTLDSLLLEADSSLLHAKQERGTAVVYDRKTSRTGELVHDLPTAMTRGQINAHVQPVVDIRSGTISHVEALARWTRPDGESVSPGEFIPLVESYGLAEKLTTTILQSVRSFDSQIPASVRVWVNISPRELDVANFAERFVAILHRLGLQPTRIGIEITETAAVRDPKRLAIELRRLRDVGVAVAIDDFGNGYSPLGYLRDLPVDIVKLDRSLVANIDSDVANQHLVIGVVGLANELGIDIVAEGVERPQERRWLAEHGVDRAQGYLFGMPVAPEDLSWEPVRVADADPLAAPAVAGSMQD